MSRSRKMKTVDFNIVKTSNLLIIELIGEIDMSNAETVKNTIKEHCTDEYKKILLDLSEITYIDSSGLGCIVAAKKYIAEQKGELKLCCLSEDIRSVFELIGLDSIIDIYDSREQAQNAGVA